MPPSTIPPQPPVGLPPNPVPPVGPASVEAPSPLGKPQPASPPAVAAPQSPVPGQPVPYQVTNATAQPNIPATADGVLYETTAFSAAPLRAQQEGLLTLYEEGKIVFACIDTSYNMVFLLQDIKLANFALGGGSSIIFTLNDGRKLYVSLANMQMRGAGMIGQGTVGGSLAGVDLTPQAGKGSKWQQVLSLYLPPEKIRKGSMAKIFLWASLVPLGIIVVAIIATSTA